MFANFPMVKFPIRWEMEMEEVETVLERIWDLHDKISDAIHAVSRTHFLCSVNGSRGGRDPPPAPSATGEDGGLDGGDGMGRFVFIKNFRAEEENAAAIAEARSLNAIRSALENLEDQLEFFHTVQSQQHAERDSAIARLEQSRIILAMRLADHRGKKFKCIEEAVAFAGDVHHVCRFVTPEALYENETTRNQLGKSLEEHELRKPSMFFQMFLSSFTTAKRSLGLAGIPGILGSAAIFAVSMLAFLQLNQVAFKDDTQIKQHQTSYRKRNERKLSRSDNSSYSYQLKHLDVMSAWG